MHKTYSKHETELSMKLFSTIKWNFKIKVESNPWNWYPFILTSLKYFKELVITKLMRSTTDRKDMGG